MVDWEWEKRRRRRYIQVKIIVATHNLLYQNFDHDGKNSCDPKF